MALYITRIPITFILEAPKARIGKTFNPIGENGIGGQGVSSQVGAAGGIQPAIAATVNALSKVSEFAAQGSLFALGLATNKIIIPMFVNPSSITVTKTPRRISALTKRGQINQYFQAEPDKVSFRGTAGGQKSFLLLNQLDVLLKSIETGTRNVVKMVYKYAGVYSGVIENFTIETNADNPNIFNYGFDFNFVDQNHFRLFMLAIRPGTLNQAIQNPKQFVKDTLKISASELLNPTGLAWKK